jgi:hypothetical protein
MHPEPGYDGYIKFILRRTLAEVLKYAPALDKKPVTGLFDYLIASPNILKDIYLVSQVRKLEPFGNYLLFICQKIRQGEISFDNLSQNITGDSEFLKQQVLSAMGYEAPAKKEPAETIGKETPGEQQQEPELFPGSIIQNKFHIQEIENEIVTEEFTESYLDEAVPQPERSRQGYLELIQNEEDEPEEVFSIPGKESEINNEQNIEEPGTETEEEPVASGDLTEEEVMEETDAKDEAAEETEKIMDEAGMASLVNELIEDEIFASESDEEAEELNALLEEDINNTIKGENETLEAVKELPGITDETVTGTADEAGEENEEIEGIEELSAIGQERPEEQEYEYIDEEPEPENEEAPLNEEINEEIISLTDEARPKTNKAYLEYETALFAVNEELNIMFAAIEADASVQYEITEKVLEKALYMEQYSRGMSFELISGIYGTIKNYFTLIKENKVEINNEHIDLLSSGLVLVESLIKDKDYLGFDEVIKKLGELNRFIEERETGAAEPSEEGAEPELIEERRLEEDSAEEIKYPERYSDRSYKENVRILKRKILELEKLFAELDTIKGYYKNYEGLRRLSGTFKVFKEFVKISKGLDLPKLAQLSESSYIFIKFLQNYRLDPFDKEVKEILKYIIYNFKLIALDKPTKDLDIFVSYLNDPVKIFTQTQKNQK